MANLKFKQKDLSILYPTICTTIQSAQEKTDFFVKKNETKDQLDIYQQFVEAFKKKIYIFPTCLEKHHILPLHAGGSNNSENILILSIEDHALAHFYRFLASKDKNDKLAYLFRKNDKKEAFLLRSKKGLLSREKKGLLKRFKDSKAQALLGKKGGKIAGSLNTLPQKKARTIVGKKDGKIVGKSNQSLLSKKLLTMFMVWEYENGLRIKTKPCDTFKKICDQLENAIPNNIRNESSFIKVLYGKRSKMYGWKLLIMVIRSEAGDGL